MGWQDAPVVKEGVPSVKPAWMSAPVAPATPAAPAAPAAKRVGGIEETLAGPSELLASGAANIPGAAINAISDLVHRIGGNADSAPLVPSVPVGAAGRQLAGDIGGMIPDAIPRALHSADASIGNASPVAQDLLHGAGHVAGDVANLLPSAGTAKLGAGIAGDIASAAEAAKAPLAAGDTERALKLVGYPSLPSKTEGAGMLPKAGASIVGEGSLTGPQSLTSQAVTDRLAQHEAGVPHDAELNYTNVEAARKAGPAKVYDAAHAALPPQLTQDPQLQTAIKGIGDTTSQLPKSPDVDALKQSMIAQPTMTSDQLFSNIQQAREKATQFYKSDLPDSHAMGDAYQGIANAYEDFVGRQLKGTAVSLEDWQDARTAFAKNYAVQAALKGTSVDASKLATLQRKDPGNLTGGLQLIAEQHNRYPLSTGFGPTTLADNSLGTSGSLAGNTARHVTGPLLGGGIGALMGGGVPGALVGSGVGQVATLGLQNIIRRALAGSPAGGRAAASAALEDPRLADFFHPPGPAAPPTPPLDLTPPPGQAFSPHQPELATASPQRDFFGTGANNFPAPEAPGASAPPATGHPGEISLADLLSHGAEQRPPEGLSAGLMGAPHQDGIPFAVNAEHAAGDLSLAHEPTLSDLLENLSDHAGVRSQGVPEGTMQRGGKGFKPNKRDRVDMNLSDLGPTLAELLERHGG